MNKLELIPRVPTHSFFNLPPEDHDVLEIVNLYFVHFCGLRYLEPSNDPIFPATLEDPDLYWIDPTPHPHFIGCRSSPEICGSDGECTKISDFASWEPFTAGLNRSTSEAAVLNFLTIVIKRAGNAMELPLLPELLADRLRSGRLSVGLDDGHWRQELRRRFTITLATMQTLVADMIQGTHDDSMGEHRLWPGPNTTRAACSSMKFQTVGWRNINLVEAILFLASLLILWVSTVKYDDRILLRWLFVAASRIRDCRNYNSTKDIINALTLAILKAWRAWLPRKLRCLPCRHKPEELQPVSRSS